MANENDNDGGGLDGWGGGGTTWGDASGTVTTNPNGPTTWDNYDGTSGFVDPNNPTPNWGPPQEAPVAPDTWEAPPETLARPAPISFDNIVPDFLRNMFKGGALNPNQQNLDRNLNNLVQTPMQDERGFWDKLGVRPLGTTAEDVFKEEAANPAMRDTRMGMWDRGIGMMGNAMVGASPLGPAMSAVRAYDSYVNDPSKNVMNAVARGASGMGGYIGALGNMYQGNYGNALTGVLNKSGVDKSTGALAGMGLNYAQGKNIAPSIGGLAGQFLGKSVGGGFGGMVGKTLGQQFGGSYSVRK
jgi:hypothetical protein